MRAPIRPKPLPVILGLGLVLPLLPESWLTAGFSRGLFPWVQRALVPITGSVGVSLSSAILLLVGVSLLVWLVRFFVRFVGRVKRGAARWSLQPLRVAALWLGGLWLWFLLAWGLGYRQAPIEDRWALRPLPGGVARTEALEAFADELASILQVPPPHREVEVALDAVKRSLADWIERRDGFRPAMPECIKTLPAGLLSSSGFTGIVSPFLLEAHVDGAVAATDRVAVGAHELAHLCGIQGEADADAVSILAGLSADDPFARYCVALRTFSLVGADLGPTAFRERFEALPTHAREDYRKRIESVRRMRSQVATKVVRRVYDGYLKSQGVVRGVRDYGRAVELVLRARIR